MTTDIQLRMRITQVRRDSDKGFWRARVNLDGTGVEVHRRYGSWMTDTTPMRDLLPWVSAALQDRVRPLENAEAKALKKEAETNPFIAKSLGQAAIQQEGAAA